MGRYPYSIVFNSYYISMRFIPGRNSVIRQAAISAVAFVRSTAARRVARGYPMIRSPMNGGKGAVGGIRVREMREKRGQRLVRTS